MNHSCRAGLIESDSSLHDAYYPDRRLSYDKLAVCSWHLKHIVITWIRSQPLQINGFSHLQSAVIVHLRKKNSLSAIISSSTCMKHVFLFAKIWFFYSKFKLRIVDWSNFCICVCLGCVFTGGVCLQGKTTPPFSGRKPILPLLPSSQLHNNLCAALFFPFRVAETHQVASFWLWLIEVWHVYFQTANFDFSGLWLPFFTLEKRRRDKRAEGPWLKCLWAAAWRMKAGLIRGPDGQIGRTFSSLRQDKWLTTDPFVFCPSWFTVLEEVGGFEGVGGELKPLGVFASPHLAPALSRCLLHPIRFDSLLHHFPPPGPGDGGGPVHQPDRCRRLEDDLPHVPRWEALDLRLSRHAKAEKLRGWAPVGFLFLCILQESASPPNSSRSTSTFTTCSYQRGLSTTCTPPSTALFPGPGVMAGTTLVSYCPSVFALWLTSDLDSFLFSSADSCLNDWPVENNE